MDHSYILFVPSQSPIDQLATDVPIALQRKVEYAEVLTLFICAVALISFLIKGR